MSLRILLPLDEISAKAGIGYKLVRKISDEIYKSYYSGFAEDIAGVSRRTLGILEDEEHNYKKILPGATYKLNQEYTFSHRRRTLTLETKEEYKAGIHLDGFRGDKDSELYRNHPDWFLKDQDGEVICQPIDRGDTFMQYIYFD